MNSPTSVLWPLLNAALVGWMRPGLIDPRGPPASGTTATSIELARQLRIALAAVTLLLATLVLWEATGPVFAKAQAPSTATGSGGLYADRNRNGELPQPRPARGRLIGAERRFGALAAPGSP